MKQDGIESGFKVFENGKRGLRSLMGVQYSVLRVEGELHLLSDPEWTSRGEYRLCRRLGRSPYGHSAR